MKRNVKILLFLVLILQLLPAQKISWPYDNRYGDKLLYLHSVANYVFPVNDDFNWEKAQFQGTAIRMSFGSVEIEELTWGSKQKSFGDFRLFSAAIRPLIKKKQI